MPPNEIDLLLNELQINNDLYGRGEPTTLTDDEYDDKLSQLRTIQPAHVFLTGVGSEVRGDKVLLPYKMGSLDQAYEGDTLKWVKDNGLENEMFIVSAKLDGISTEIIYSDGAFQIGYSRGNGIEGADISRHLRKIHALPNTIKTAITTVIRAEIIMSRPSFKKFQEECLKRKYKTYKNARNAVAGMMNSKTLPDWIYGYFDVIGFTVIGNLDKEVQLEAINACGIYSATSTKKKGSELTDEFLTKTIGNNKERWGLRDFEQDGVVIDVNDHFTRKRMNPSSNSLNPAYSKKFKVRDTDNIATTTVLGVEWGASKHGLIKPRVNIEPVILQGVTIDFATGFNAKYIVDNYIGADAIIKLTRSGDVIPHILDVVTPAYVPDIPDEKEFGAYDWNQTEVDFILDNPKGNKTVLVKEIASFFASLDVPKLKIGVATKLFDAGYDTIAKVINMNEDELIGVIGKNGSTVFNGINDVLNNVTVFNFMGSLVMFGQGLGKRMFEKIYDHYGQCEDLTIDDIIAVSGFEFKTACKIAGGMDEYREFILQIDRDIRFVDKVIHSGKFDGKTFVFTGFRDKTSQESIELQGGTIGSSVNKDTTYLVTKDPTSTSGKVGKARKLGVNIISIDDMLGMI